MPDPTDDIIDYLFEYHAPNQAQVDGMKVVRARAKELARAIHEHCPPSADRTDAVRKLQECVNTCNRGITLNGRGYR